MTKQVDVVIKNSLVKKRVIAKFNNEIAENGQSD